MEWLKVIFRLEGPKNNTYIFIWPQDKSMSYGDGPTDYV